MHFCDQIINVGMTSQGIMLRMVMRICRRIDTQPDMIEPFRIEKSASKHTCRTRGALIADFRSSKCGLSSSGWAISRCVPGISIQNRDDVVITVKPVTPESRDERHHPDKMNQIQNVYALDI